MKFTEAISEINNQILSTTGNNVDICKFCLEKDLKQSDVLKLSVNKHDLHDCTVP